MTEQDSALSEAIRKADSFTNAATVLADAEETGYPADPYPGYWDDIREHVIPLLEEEASKASEEAARLRSRA
jgi:hypothetical protein